MGQRQWLPYAVPVGGGPMRHLAYLVVALVMALAASSGPTSDTCSTGFLILWLAMFLSVEVIAACAAELMRMTS